MNPPQPITCHLCGKEFGQNKIKLFLHLLPKYIKSYIKWLPRKIGKAILPQYKYASSLDNCLGFVSTKGKVVIYGEQYNNLHFWGMVD